MLTRAKQLIDRVEQRTRICESLTEADMTRRHGVVVWRASAFTGTPHFYPVYRFEDYYSYSPLALILKKRRFILDRRVPPIVDGPEFDYLPSSLCIDREIERIGGPHACGFNISNVGEFAESISRALIDDTRLVEQANPGHTNVILCGGRDSLNLLLLPWNNETLAVSARPNYDNVVRFVSENELAVKVLELGDDLDVDELNDEILECCCRAELTHWRWGASLRRIARDLGGKLVLWKGQHGDLYTTPTWKAYTEFLNSKRNVSRQIYKKASDLMPRLAAEAIGRRIQPKVIRTAWYRGASLQGSHMGFLREIADCLVASAYHGPAMIKVWEQADLASVAQRDMRDMIGRILHGRDVVYPRVNPAPGPSEIRRGLSRTGRFIDLIKQTGIHVQV